jgi:Zn-dependent protease with chaperone function
VNFLDYQAEARTNTVRFVVLYGLGVLFLGSSTALVTHFVLNFDGVPLDELTGRHWSLVATSAILTWGVIFLGAVWRTTQLGQGGKTVAESLGGTLLTSGTANGLERRGLNIVEEMALAAGIPVPPVYVLKREQGINAFAAGWSQDDAVIGLTSGALEKLTRAELQGVIAHEFSHIVNRDTALNMRLLGVLHGIVVLSAVGEFLLRMRSTDSNRKAVAPFFLIGVAVWLFGSLGAFLAQLIQARVSREREFLADASAVQFTRDPNGIAQALAKIARESSHIESSFARSASHMLIAAPTERRLFDLSSHPPLKKRILRLLPSWDGRIESLAPAEPKSAVTVEASLPQPSRGGQLDPLMASGLLPMQVAFAADTPVQADVPKPERGREAFTIPADLLASAREPYGARLILLAGMLDDEPRLRAGQLIALSAMPEYELVALPKIRARLDQIDPPERLPLLSLTLGSLAALSTRQAERLLLQIAAVRSGLGPMSHRAFCVCRLGLRHLKAPRELWSQSKIHSPGLTPARAIGRLLGVVARRGGSSTESAARAFDSGVRVLHPSLRPGALPPLQELELDRIDEALDVLIALNIQTRRQIADALVATAREDGILRALEAELLSTFRVCLNVAVTIDSPSAVKP